MMTEPPIGELLEKVDCRYTLAVEASKRAREIIAGSLPLIDTKETKPLSIAIEEINRKLITYSRTGVWAYSIWSYFADIAMVSIDIVLYFRNRKLDRLRESTAA